MQPKLQIRLLGDFRAAIGGKPVTSLNTPRLQALLAYLLLHRDAAQSRQHVAFLFWPDSSEDQALANLRNVLFSLRRALPFTARYLKADRNILQWQGGAALEIDVFQFEHALAEAEQAAREGDTHAQQTCLQRAVDLYRGDLLPSSYEDWVLVERERLQQRFTSALESLIGLFEREGNVQGAISASQRLLRHYPLHEAIYKRLMELYAASGMVAEALRIYHTCATTLERELGVEPSANTREVYERLLNSRQGPRGHPPAQGANTAQHAHTVLPPVFPVKPALRVATPLTGRAPEWALLQEVWQEANKGPRVALIRGEAGIGKTRLVEELFNWVARQGAAAASARCYPIEKQLAFGPVADWLHMLPIPPLSPVWLSEAARLRPNILAEFPLVPAPGPLTEAWQRRRFMEAVSRLLLASRPLLLTLDDLQWCDSDTLEYLHFLLRYDDTARLLLVMTARTEEIDTVPNADRAEALAHLLDGLRDTQHLLEIDLTPLNQEDTAKLAAELSVGQSLDLSQISELYRETEGNPLFIVEMLRTGWLQQSGMRLGSENRMSFGNMGNAGMNARLPPRIARVLNTRLGQLSPSARGIVDYAASIGRDFTLSLLQLASKEDESTIVSALDELWRHRIVREQGEDGYDFSHDKLRQAAYSMLTAAKRRMLHGRVAHALEEAYAGRLDLVYAQLGMHYEMAGNPIPAAHCYQQAAEGALRLYANAEAIWLYQQAFDLVQQATAEVAVAVASNLRNDTRDGSVHIVEVGESLADLLETTGNHVKARSTYEKVLGFCPESHPLWKARLMLKIGDTWRSQRQFDTAIEFYDALDTLLGDEPYDPNVDWWDLRIEDTVARLMVYYWQDAPVEMLKFAERMQSVLERYGTRLQKVKFYRCLAIMHLRLDRYTVSDECLRYVVAALEETRKLNNLTELADTTFLMGFCLLWRGQGTQAPQVPSLSETSRSPEPAKGKGRRTDLPSAVNYLRQALSLTERTGQADYQLLSLAYLTIAYRMQGDVQRTRETVARHVAYMDSVQMPSYSETAEANLAWVAWKEGDLEAAKRHAKTALAKFSEGESFTWLVTWPLVAVSLDQGNLSDAVRFAAAQLAPTAQRAPEELIADIEGAVEAWERQQSDQAATHLRHALQVAHQCGYI